MISRIMSVLQTNKAGHTGSAGWWRLVSQPTFYGDVEPGAAYILVDDFVGMGGTFANLKGYVEAKGGSVLSAVSLTGQERSAAIRLLNETLQKLRERYGELEPWWKAEFGYGFDAFTESEAQYLLRAGDIDTIRNRLAEAAAKD